MKKLTLLRHAKSSWNDPGQDDFDRPLNERGRRDAPAMAAFMKREGIAPDVVLCSTAARTRETLALIGAEIGRPAETLLRDSIYLASPEIMLDELKKVSDNRAHALLIGHNPGLEMLAAVLADRETSTERDLKRLQTKFPTAALAHFDCDINSWKDLKARSARLMAFVTPKDL